MSSKIKKKLLKNMNFDFLNGIGVKRLSDGDVLTAIREPSGDYLVRSVLSPEEQPYIGLDELIYFLSSIGEVTFCQEYNYIYKEKEPFKDLLKGLCKSKIIVSERDKKIFFDAVLADTEPNEKLREAAKRYRDNNPELFM